MNRRPNCLMRRVYGVLRGVEDIVAALTCRDVRIRGRANPKGGVTLECRVRWWAPAAWIAWVRIVVFRDRCGCAYYDPSRAKAYEEEASKP